MSPHRRADPQEGAERMAGGVHLVPSLQVDPGTVFQTASSSCSRVPQRKDHSHLQGGVRKEKEDDEEGEE